LPKKETKKARPGLLASFSLLALGSPACHNLNQQDAFGKLMGNFKRFNLFFFSLPKKETKKARPGPLASLSSLALGSPTCQFLLAK